MKPSILVRGDFSEVMIKLISEHYQLIYDSDLEACKAAATEIRGIATRSSIVIDDDTMKRFPQLGIITICGVGHENIALAAAKARGIMVTNCPGIMNDSVAELSIGLILALLRKIPQAHRFVQAGRWASGTFALGQNLKGKHVGIYGFGRVGAAIAKKLCCFDVETAYHGRNNQQLGLPYFKTLTGLANWSDILIVAVPGGPATRHSIDSDVLEALGQEGFLVNIARGSILCEEDLLEALENRTIAGAALDVFPCEPQVNARYLSLDNIVLTPHLGSATEQTRVAMCKTMIKNLNAFFSNRELLNPVGEILETPEVPRETRAQT